MKCTHCLGNIIGDQCLQCARYTDDKIITIQQALDVQKKHKKPGPKPTGRNQGVLGTCRCCKHTKRIWSDGLCSSCVSFVNGHYGKYWPIGSKEREDVLKRVAAWKTTKGRRKLKEYGMGSINA